MRLLVGALVAILAILEIKALVGTVLIAPRFAVDLEIPLRAAERWLGGGPPYLASAFTSPPGATQPFLYPPYTLPVLAVLTELPRQVAGLLAVGLSLLVAVITCRRLEIPWIWVPLVLMWPPFAESIFGANVQVILFAAFVFLFYARGGSPWRPDARDVSDPAGSSGLVGGLATLVGAIKVSQPHPWIYVLRHRPRAAIAGAIGIAAIVLATLPMTGLGLWSDWLAQLRLAADPTWDLGGFALPRFFPGGVGLLIAVVCIVATWFVPQRNTAAWVGLFSVVGSLSLHIFGLLLLIPAMLVIRRELAVLAAISIATYSYEGAWAGIVVCAVAFAAITRWPQGPGVRRPHPGGPVAHASPGA